MPTDRSWRLLLIAFSDAAPAFRPGHAGTRASLADRGPGRRLLEAFADVRVVTRDVEPRPRGKNWADLVVLTTPGRRALAAVRDTTQVLVLFSAAGVAVTAWTALRASAVGAGAVAALVVLTVGMLLIPVVLFVRQQTALAVQLASTNAATVARSLFPPPAERTVPDRVRGAGPEGSFWGALDPAERADLLALAGEFSFAQGDTLLRQGDPADHAFVIRSGWAKVTTQSAGRERVLAVRGPGELIGEPSALWPSARRSATVVALSEVQASFVSRDDFVKFLAHHPSALNLLERLVYERLTDAPDLPREIEPAAGVERRLAASITGLIGAQPGVLPMTVQDLARWVSVPEGVVVRVLTSWQVQGLVRTEHGKIDVLIPQRLAGLAASSPVRTAEAPFWSGRNCTIVFTDIVRFAAAERTDADRQSIRDALSGALRGAFDAAALSWDAAYREDRGDGVLIVLPPNVATAEVLAALVPRLAARLAAHNAQAAGARQIRLRVALEVGPVVSDPAGVVGSSIIHAARLLEAPELGRRVVAMDATVGLIVSTFVHDTVAKHAGVFERTVLPGGKSALEGWMRFF